MRDVVLVAINLPGNIPRAERIIGVVLVDFNWKELEIWEKFLNSHLLKFNRNFQFALGEDLFARLISKNDNEKQWAINLLKTILASGKEAIIKHTIAVLCEAVHTSPRRKKVAKALEEAGETELLKNLKERCSWT